MLAETADAISPAAASAADTSSGSSLHCLPRALTEAIGDEQLAEIRAHVQQQRALGNDRFQRLIKAELGRCARVRPPIGRVAIPGWRQNKVF